jgi:hypothetical protein
MEGIVHLHGIATNDYGGPEGDGFVLSSSEFGRAYLSDGWATRFFKDIVSRYVVVFVGYSAEDPPVQYLLEALNSKADHFGVAYAFQAGKPNEAVARWSHKGVKAIAYSEENKHIDLWKTLEAWAVRARSPDTWYSNVIEAAKLGPAKLQPYERGQVAHVVSTFEGARRFAEGDSPPGAEWLFVFDRIRRLASPGYSGDFRERGPYVDPFEQYGLDSDETPLKIDPESHYAKRDVPATAWDGFFLNTADRKNAGENSFSALRGHWSANVPRLPPRLAQLGLWIAKVSEQPATVCWAANEDHLHPDIQARIRWELNKLDKEIPAAIRQAWRYIFEIWKEKPADFHGDWYELKGLIAKEGWSSAFVRKYGIIKRPLLKVEQNRWTRLQPPESKDELTVESMLSVEVEYPITQDDIIIPDEWLEHIVRELRKNLEHALDLEGEIGGYRLKTFGPIIPGDQSDDFSRTQGLTGSVVMFSILFNRLAKHDLNGFRLTNHMACGLGFDGWLFPGEPRRRR